MWIPIEQSMMVSSIVYVFTGSVVRDWTEQLTLFGVVFTILKGRQHRIHHSDSEWFFSTNRISVTTAQIEIKWDLITKT